MSQTEALILADISNTRAAYNRVLAGVASAGDYTIGGKKVDRAKLITALSESLGRLTGQLNEMPGEIATTMDGEAVSDLGVVDVEYVGDET